MKKILNILFLTCAFMLSAQSVIPGPQIQKFSSGTITAGSPYSFDSYSAFRIRTTTPGLTFTIPTPSPSTDVNKTIIIVNDSMSGSVPFTISPGGVIALNKYRTYRWTGTRWAEEMATPSGSASSAAALSPGRNINGVLFDGTSNVTVTAAASTLTGNTLATGVTNSSINTINSSIGNGILKTSGGAGAISTAVSNTDYLPPTSPTMTTATLNGTTIAAGKLNLIPTAVNNVEGDSASTTTRLTLSTYQQSNQTGGYGDLIRMIAEHGSAKAGIKWFSRGKSAQVVTTNSEPFNVTTGQTLTLKINGSAVRTVTFNTSLGSFTSGAATADQISDIICKSINYTSYPTGLVGAIHYGQASPYLTQLGTTVNQDALKVAINSCTYGTSSSIEITGGTALTGLGLSIGTTFGSAGSVTFDDATTARQIAWIVAHDYPNNPASNNPHKHISFEVPDSSGEMQTRLGITYGKNVSEVTVSSAIFIVNGYPITVANSANSFKDVDFSRDNTGRQISRVAQIRTDSDANGGNVLHRVFDNAGTPTTLLTLNRLSKFVALGGAIQTKIRPTANTAQSVMTLSPQNGNVFQLSGTGTVNYIANTDWQAGSELIFTLQGAATLTNNAGSPTGTNRQLKLLGSTNFTSGVSGSTHTFVYDGSAYSNAWVETARVVYDAEKITASATLDFGSTAVGAATDLTMTVTGAASGDVCSVGAPNGSVPNNGTFFCWVSATNTVTVRFSNPDQLNPKDPASGTFKVVVTK